MCGIMRCPIHRCILWDLILISVCLNNFIKKCNFTFTECLSFGIGIFSLLEKTGEISGRLVTEVFLPALGLVGVPSASESELELELESELELDELDEELLTEDVSDWMSSLRRAVTRVSVDFNPL